MSKIEERVGEKTKERKLDCSLHSVAGYIKLWEDFVGIFTND